MDERYSTKRLLALRKLTRAAADLLRGEVKEYLATLSPLLRQRTVFGDHVKGSLKEAVKGADIALKEVQSLYEAIAPSQPFGLSRELRPPLDIVGTAVELTPTEYAHAAKSERETKTVTVSSPLRWVLHYAGCAPRRLKELLAERDRTGNELQQVVVHYLMLHVVLTRQPGVARILQELRCPLSTGRLEGCGDLPITYVSAAVTTVRPPDDVLIENTEISGMDVFEEVLKTDDLLALRDPLKERLIELAKRHGEDLTAGSSRP
jgi:hypothetical protein